MKYAPHSLIFKHIIKESIPFSLLAFLILTLLVLAQQASKSSDLVFVPGLGPRLMIAILQSLLPGVMTFTIPVALLLGAIVTISRLLADSEWTVLKAAGVSNITLALPFLFLGCLGFALTFYCATKLAPRKLQALRALKTQISLREITTGLKPKTFITQFPSYLLRINGIDEESGDWLGVFLLTEDAQTKQQQVLTAERARISLPPGGQPSFEVQLTQGMSFAYAPDKPLSTAASFQNYSLRLADSQFFAAQRLEPAKGLLEMTMSELKRAVTDASTETDRRRAKVEWHKRLALATACLFLSFAGFVVVNNMTGKRGRSLLVVWGFSLALLFYLLLTTGQNLALSGRCQPWLGIWGAITAAAILLALAPRVKRLLQLSSLPLPRTLWFKRFFKRKTQTKSAETFGLLTYIHLMLVSEITGFYLIAAFILTAVTLLFTLLDLAPAISRKGFSGGYVAQYLGYLSPQIYYFVAPFAFMLAVLIVGAILAKTRQLTIMFGLRQHPLKLVLPLTVLATFLTVILFALANWVLPFSNREQDYRHRLMKGKSLEEATVLFGRRWSLSGANAIYGYRYLDQDRRMLNTIAYKINLAQNRLREAALLDRMSPGETPDQWRIEGGLRYRISDNFAVSTATLSPAQPETLTIPDSELIFNSAVIDASKMSFAELNGYIEQVERTGTAVLGLKMDQASRLAFPFSSFTLLVLVLPFTALPVRKKRQDRWVGIVAPIGLGLIFWGALSIFEVAGKQANIPVWLAAWGPHILFLALGVYLLFKVARQS